MTSARYLFAFILLYVLTIYRFYPLLQSTPEPDGLNCSKHALLPAFKPLHYRSSRRNSKNHSEFHHRILPCTSPNSNKMLMHSHGRNYSHAGINATIFGSQTVGHYRHDSYILVPNYLKARMTFSCNDSITFTTHGGPDYLENVVPLVERWEGPVSVAVYAPGSDFSRTVKIINFLRECTSPLIRQLVTFHLFFDVKFREETRLAFESLKAQGKTDCTEIPRFESQTFRRERNLTYPVNVGRNLARNLSTTHYVLAADIELYPSPNLIPLFFQMLARHRRENQKTWIGPREKGRNQIKNPQTTVYYVPVFEVEKWVSPPLTKADLKVLLKAGLAVKFHEKFCDYCHEFPSYKLWLRRETSPTRMIILQTLKRDGRYDWEPVYVGTRADPPFSEELSREGLRNKMTQGYAMCLLDYKYMVLDNAFLVHRSGIKQITPNGTLKEVEKRQNNVIHAIARRLEKTYGKRKTCLI